VGTRQETFPSRFGRIVARSKGKEQGTKKEEDQPDQEEQEEQEEQEDRPVTATCNGGP
jgi:hypothetical protein